MENNKNAFIVDECYGRNQTTNCNRARLPEDYPFINTSSPNYAELLVNYISNYNHTESKINLREGEAHLNNNLFSNQTTFSPPPNALFVTSQDVLSKKAWEIMLNYRKNNVKDNLSHLKSGKTPFPTLPLYSI